MNKRICLLLLLAAVTIAFRGLHIWQIVSQPAHTRFATGLDYTVTDGWLTVHSVREQSPAGPLTTAARAGLQRGDRILAIYNAHREGGTVRSMFDYYSVIRTIREGEPWILVVSRDAGQGQRQEVQVTMPPAFASDLSLQAWLLIIAMGIALPLLAIFTAFFIGLMKPDDDNAILACLLFLSFSSIFGIPYETFPVGVRELSLLFHTTLNVFVVYLFLLFFLRFPSPSLIDRKAPWLKYAFLGLTIPTWILDVMLTWARSASFDRFQEMTNVVSRCGRVIDLLALVMFLTGLASLILNTVRAKSGNEKRRLLILLAGTMVGLLPIVIYSTIYPIAMRAPSLWVVSLLAALLGIFPLSFVYVVIKHRVLGIRVIIRIGLQYALVSRGFLAVEGIVIFTAILFGLRPPLLRFLNNAGVSVVAIGSAIITLALVAGLRRINQRVMPIIDRHFFREAYNVHQVLSDLSRAVRTLAAQPGKLLETVASRISDSLHPDRVAIFLRGAEISFSPTNGYRAGSALIKLVAPGAESYRCCEFHSRLGYREDLLSAPEACVGLTLPADSFISRYLKKTVPSDPEPLEVLLEDPLSWGASLTTADSQANLRYEERKLLEQLNTRLIVPLTTGERLLGFINLGEKLSEEPYTKEDKELLVSVAQQTAIALDYAWLISQASEQEKLKREIEIAREVQAELFPQALPEIRTLDYTGVCNPARGVGGDYYDFLLLSADKLGIAVGDIAGKGISAALLMASLQASLRSQAPLHGERIDELIGDINRQMYASTGSNKYATFFYGLYDDTRHTLTYVNAGHNAPMLFRTTKSGIAQPGIRNYATNLAGVVVIERPPLTDALRLQKGGQAVGMFPNTCYQQETIQLYPEDILVIFTDGVTEATNIDQEEFGETRLAELIFRHRSLSAVELRDLILTETARFVGEATQQDDLTLVVVKVV